MRDSAVTSAVRHSAVRYSAVFSLRDSAVKQNNLHSSTLDQNRTLTAMRNVSPQLRRSDILLAKRVPRIYKAPEG